MSSLGETLSRILLGGLAALGLGLIRVRGRSMAPTLADGDYVLVRRPGRRGALTVRTGDVVCVRRPGLPMMIKRLGARDGASGRFALSGDGIGSMPSVDLGTVAGDEVLGRAVLVISARRVFRPERVTEAR